MNPRSLLSLVRTAQQQLAVDLSGRRFHDHYATRIQAKCPGEVQGEKHVANSYRRQSGDVQWHASGWQILLGPNACIQSGEAILLAPRWHATTRSACSAHVASSSPLECKRRLCCSSSKLCKLFPFTLSRLLLQPGTIKFDDCGKKLRSSGRHASIRAAVFLHPLLACCPSGFVSYLYRREREIQIQEPCEKGPVIYYNQYNIV